MLKNILSLSAGIVCLIFATFAFAQGATINFATTPEDAESPIEITADSLELNQESGFAIFKGDVVAGQGTMRLSAAEVRVEYGENGSEISQMIATGGVIFISGEEAAEAETAIYEVASSQIRMTGNVLVTQGQSALSGETLILDTATGNGKIEGRVRTVFRTDQ